MYTDTPLNYLWVILLMTVLTLSIVILESKMLYQERNTKTELKDYNKPLIMLILKLTKSVKLPMRQ